jgi:hypothetical protein
VSGGNVSGVLVPRWDADDRFKFASNFAWGIGRYITDLGTLGGQDAVYDPLRNQLRALVVSSGYLGYERLWRPTFTSAVTYGIVKRRQPRHPAGQRVASNAARLDQPHVDPDPSIGSGDGVSGRHPREQRRQARQLDAASDGDDFSGFRTSNVER